MKTVDVFDNIATSLTFVKLFPNTFGLIKKTIYFGIICGCTLSKKKVFNEMIVKTKKNTFERAQQTVHYFHKFYGSCFQDNVIDKKEYESLCNFLTKHVNENKNGSF